jgi:hypothetical protein
VEFKGVEMKELRLALWLVLLGLYVFAYVGYADEMTILYNDGSVGVIDVDPGYIEMVHEVAESEWGESREPSPGPVITDAYGEEAYPLPED